MADEHYPPTAEPPQEPPARRRRIPEDVDEALCRIADMGVQIDALHHHSTLRHHHHRQEQKGATLRTIQLTAQQPKVPDDIPDDARSIGVYNPTGIVIYWGIGGGMAEPGRKAISQPARSLLILPVAANSIEVGAAATDLAAGDAIVFVLRFRVVQAPFFGAV